MSLYISTGGEGVKIDIGNMSNVAMGHNAGGFGVGNNCIVNGETCASWRDARSGHFHYYLHTHV